jgi:RNA polymerase sigma-70 factor (ECF subfamily)
MNNQTATLEDLLANDAWIRALARRLVADEHAAEDLVQEAWLRALEGPRDRLRRPRAWLGGVVRNLARRRNRSLTRQREHERRAARPDRLPSVDEVLDQEATRLRLVKAALSLDEPHRSAIIHRFFRDLPPRVIAEQLGVTVEAVEKRIRRGLEQLRARLDREFGNRKSWCAALLPLVGRVPTGPATSAAGASSASILAGALVMSTKIKIGIAVIVALGAAYAFWPRDEVEPPEVPKAEVVKPAAPVAKKASEAEPSAAKQADVTAKAANPTAEAAPAPISLEPRRGSIVGVVTDQNGAPIAEASVKALRFVPGAVELKQLLETKTDRVGHYVLKPVEERCVVEAAARKRYQERKMASPYTRVDFTLGEPGVVRGKIVCIDGPTPVGGVAVGVYRWRPTDMSVLPGDVEYAYAWRRPPIASARSNRRGEYLVGHLRPGSYQVRVFPGRYPQIHSSHDPIEIHGGRETIKDFVLPRGKTVVGQVTDEDSGIPIPGAEIYVDPNRYRHVIADQNGHYRLPGFGLTPSGNTLVVSAAGYWPTVMPVGWNVNQRQPVCDVRLKRGATVRGRVVGPNGPVAGARVAASSRLLQTQEQKGWTIPCATTDGKGEFKITAATDGSRRVYAIKEDMGWGASDELVLSPGEQKSGVVVPLNRSGTVAGRVTDADGRPIESAGVTLWEGLPIGGAVLWSGRKTAFTRPDGQYEIETVPAGTYQLRVLPPGVYSSGNSPLSGVIHSPILVIEGERTEVNVNLRPGPVIAGRVVDQSGQPIQDAVVRASVHQPGTSGWSMAFQTFSPPFERVAPTDAGGHFRLEGLADVAQAYIVTAQKYGFDPAIVRKVLPNGPDVLISLTEFKRLEGRVVYASTGKPAQEFRIAPGWTPGPGKGTGSP